jgi:hypothetical protein
MQRCRKDFTVRGLVAELAERGLKVDYRRMWEFVHAEKLSYKKKTLIAAEQDLPSRRLNPSTLDRETALEQAMRQHSLRTLLRES